MSRVAIAIAAPVLCHTLVTQVLASPPPLSVPVSEEGGLNGGEGSNGILGDLQRTNFLLGDLFGLRSRLSPYGVTIAIQETSEVFGNPIGGVHHGPAYDGLTQAILQLDTQRAFGWYGGLFNVSALQIHGRNFSADNLGSLQTASGIEADRATRLWELWYQQKFLDEDRLDIKIGQQSVDQEFIVNPNGAYFVNTMFGWPVVPSYDLPGGGPAYPLSAPGIRVRYRPINPLAILIGVYSGSPASTNDGDAQMVNRSGVQFPVNQGPLVFAELQYTYPAIGGMVDPDETGAPLGHTYRFGAWYDAEHFDDLRIDNTGTALADPNSSGVPRSHYGNFSIYAVADQMVWRNSVNPNESISVFGRGMGTPQGNRNLVDYSFNGGAVWHGAVKGRHDDTVGLGFGYAHVSKHAARADADTIAYNPSAPGMYQPVRSSETFLEAFYQYQVHPWWQIQPDAQYVFKPGGGAQNPIQPSQHIKNELVLGVRTNVLF